VFGACGDERDAILKEYVEKKVNLTPACTDFTQSGRSQFFTYKQLTVNERYTWALLRGPLTVTKEKGYGLDKWREEYGAPRITNSVYRSPVKNEAVGGAPQSRHMYGDAADLRNQSGQDFEYDAMVTAAQRAKADYIEPVSGPCKKACVHADWRDTSGDYHK
jgi:Peptidase M15